MIAAGQAHSAEIQLTGGPHRHRKQPSIENDDRGAGDRSADRHLTTGLKRTCQRDHHRRLSGTVGVEHPAARCPARHQVGRARLAADDDGSEIGQAVGHRGIGVRHRRQRGRCQEQVGDALSPQHPAQFDAPVHIGRYDDQRRARGEGQQQFEDRGIEARGGEMHGARTRTHAVPRVLFGGERGQPAMGDRHTLGPAGRSGGVDQVGDVIDGQSSRTIGVGDRFRRGGAVSGDQRRVVQA